MMDSKMALLVLLSLVLTSLANEQCPTNMRICNCDGEGVNCMNIKSEDELRQAFQQTFPFNAIRGLWVQGTPLKSLSQGVFGIVAIQQLYIEKNEVERVDLGVLVGSGRIMNTLSFYGNKLSNFPFDELKHLTVLRRVNLGMNQLTGIPNDAFRFNPHLMEIILAFNKITSIPDNLFNGLNALSRVDVSGNSLTVMGPGSLAFSSQANLLVYLNNNGITKFDPQAFRGSMPVALILAFNKLTSLPPEPFGRVAQDMAKRGGQIDVTGNPFSCYGCDYYWIVSNKQALYYMLPGFQCTDGRNIQHLELYMIGCN